MPDKWKIDEIKTGEVMETTFWANPVESSTFRFRATHLDGRRAPKIVLCASQEVRAGTPCLVRIKTITRGDRKDRGMIEVEFVRNMSFKLEGVYMDPVASKKLQVLLESGLNILLDGPQGCGKTVLARAVAKTLGMEYVFFNCSAVIETSDFLATIQVRASKTGQPVTDFVKTDLLVSLEEAAAHPSRSYLIFLDEFNRCRESARNGLMPALDATRKIFNPTDNRFLDIPDNVQFIAAVNRGSEFSGTFGIDAAQLDRFAPLQMDYMPPEEETSLLRQRHPELAKAIVERIVEIADRVRTAPDLDLGLSVRAAEEACIYLKHPLFEGSAKKMLPEVLKSSFCGRFPGRWNDVSSDAGIVWALIQAVLREKKR
jgi:MoxR-like ATPase